MHIDISAWSALQQQFSDIYSLSLEFVDLDGTVKVSTGKDIPLTSLMRSQKMTSDLAKNDDKDHISQLIHAKGPLEFITFSHLQKILVPVYDNNILAGVLATEFAQEKEVNAQEFKDLSFLSNVSEHELRRAAKESVLSHQKDEVVRIMVLFSTIAPRLTKERKELSKLTIIKEFTHVVSGVLDLTRLTNIVGRFVEPLLKSSSLTLITFKDKTIGNIYHSEAEFSQPLLSCDLVLCRDLSQSKMGEYIQDTSKDVRLSTIPQKPKRMMTIPLLQNKLLQGALFIHGDYLKILEENDIEYLTLMTEYLTSMVSNSLLMQQIERLTITDPLTQLYNRRFFTSTLQKEIDRSRRSRVPLSILLFDIDHFKNYNDVNGHQAGDDLLKELALLLSRSLRTTDLAARYGGEEFIVILPETTIQGAELAAEKIRKSIEEYEFFNACKQPLGVVSVSIGATAFGSSDTIETIIKRADDYLYAAKNKGRNCFVSDSTKTHTLNDPHQHKELS